MLTPSRCCSSIASVSINATAYLVLRHSMTCFFSTIYSTRSLEQKLMRVLWSPPFSCSTQWRLWPNSQKYRIQTFWNAFSGRVDQPSITTFVPTTSPYKLGASTIWSYIIIPFTSWINCFSIIWVQAIQRPNWRCTPFLCNDNSWHGITFYSCIIKILFQLWKRNERLFRRPPKDIK